MRAAGRCIDRRRRRQARTGSIVQGDKERRVIRREGRDRRQRDDGA